MQVCIQLEYEVLGPEQEILCLGETVLACVDVDRGKPTRLPAELIQIAKAVDEVGKCP